MKLITIIILFYLFVKSNNTLQTKRNILFDDEDTNSNEQKNVNDLSECRFYSSSIILGKITNKYPCIVFESTQNKKLSKRSKRSKRDKGASHNSFLDIGGVRTIEEVQTNNYIINNGSDGKIFSQMFNEHYTTTPYLGSWRDWCLIISISAHIFWVIIFFSQSKSLNLCDFLLRCCFPVCLIRRAHEVQQKQLVKNSNKIKNNDIAQSRPTPNPRASFKQTPTVSTIQFHNDFIDDF